MARVERCLRKKSLLTAAPPLLARRAAKSGKEHLRCCWHCGVGPLQCHQGERRFGVALWNCVDVLVSRLLNPGWHTCGVAGALPRTAGILAAWDEAAL